MIHSLLIKDGFISPDVNVKAVQRFIKANDLKSARVVPMPLLAWENPIA